jgi:prephenate dehydratase
MQRQMAKSIVLLGPMGATFSHRAWHSAARLCAIPWDDDKSPIVAVSRNADILAKLIELPGSYGLIAAETEVRRRVNESIESFSRVIAKYHNGDCPIQIIGAVRMPLSFALMARRGKAITDIKGVLGHPQAIAACEAHIKKRGWHIMESTSNGRAAEAVANEEQFRDFAALGPSEAADVFGLNKLHAAFEDAPAITTFFVVGPSSHKVASGMFNRVLMVFRLRDGPMAFVNAIMPFGQMGLNLTYVHSIPNDSRTYDFLAEIQCDKAQINDLQLALKVFKRVTLRSIVFGPFPVMNA